MIAAFANGDARIALNTLEMVVLNGEKNAAGGITVKKEIWSSASAENPCFTIKTGKNIII